jgi:hypothetical protein
MKRLIQDLDKEADRQLGKERLEKIFNMAWPELRAAIDEALEGRQLPQKSQRDPADMLAEIIDIIQRMERTGQWISGPAITVSPAQFPSNETLAASKAPPPVFVTGSDLSGRTFRASYGPIVDPPYAYEDLPQDLGEDSPSSED